MESPFYYLLTLTAQSDGVTKIVLGVLAILYCVCGMIFAGKVLSYRNKKRELTTMREKLQQIKHKDQARDLVIRFPHTISGEFIGALLVLQQQSEMGMLSIRERQEEVAQLIDRILVEHEAHSAVLVTVAAIAPLLGLFGTVWGLIHSFMGISQTRVADIAAIAPGIAEALITTLAGLVVAIPVLIKANILTEQVKTLEAQLMALAADLYKKITVTRTMKDNVWATAPDVVDQRAL